MTTVIFAGGYGNLYGDYGKKTAKGWLARVRPQADFIEGLDVDWFGAAELHAEKDAHLPLMEALGDVWDVAPGPDGGVPPGGNLFLFKKDRLKILDVRSKLCRNRWMTKWNVEQAGVRYWTAGVHFTAGADKGADRAEQARALVDFTKTIHRGIVWGDLNSASGLPGYPHHTLAAAGWVDLRAASEKPVANAGLSSHANTDPKAGKWIEGMFPRDLVSVRSAAAVPTNGLSDHTLWFRADFQITS
jgi:hypothetical protein